MQFDIDLRNDLRSIGDLVWEEPEQVDALISSYGETPSQDPAVKAMQLIMVASVGNEAEFDQRYYDHIDTRDFSLGGAIKKVGGFFKKAGGKVGGAGKKVGGFLGGLFKGKKKKLAQAMAKVDAGIPLSNKEQRWLDKWGPKAGGAGAGYPGGGYDVREKETEEEKKKKKEEEDKKKKQMQLAWGIGIVVFVGIIITVIVIMTKDD